MTINVEEKLRRALHNLGLTDYEMRAYISLLKAGKLTASELSEVAGVPYSKIYDVLENLEKKGWIRSCLLYTSPSPRDISGSRMPSSA